jgi:hypothetical protein
MEENRSYCQILRGLSFFIILLILLDMSKISKKNTNN